MELKKGNQWELTLRCYGQNIDINELEEETLKEIVNEVRTGNVSGVADFYGEPLDWSFMHKIGIIDYAVSVITDAAIKSILNALTEKKMKGWT